MSRANSLTQCAAEGCDVLKASHLLMCLRHWSMLPDNIKRDVYDGHALMQDGCSARHWLIARERARLFVAVRLAKPDSIIDKIEAEIERLEAVRL
jgi:hypothetical protein